MKRLIFITFFYLVPLFDTITGLLFKLHLMGDASLGSPSQLVKFFLWLCFFREMTKNNNYTKTFGFILISLVYAVFESCIAVFYDNSFYAFSYGLLNIFKVTYLWLFFLCFDTFIKNQYVTLTELLHLFKLNGLICVSLIFLTMILHLSQPTYYEGTFGSKGLFLSGNGMSLYLGAISFLSLIIAKQEGGRKNYLQALYMIAGSTIIGTKASIIFLLINFLYFCFAVVKHGKIFVFGFSLVLFIINFSFFETVFDVIVSRFKNKGNLFTFLMSARDGFVKDALAHFSTDGFLAIRIFTGLGAFLSFREPGTKLPFDTLENDVFDIFFMYGLIGLFFYISVIVYCFDKLLKKRQSIWLIFSSTIFVYSMIAGHSVFNQTSGILIPLCVLISKYRVNFEPYKIPVRITKKSFNEPAVIKQRFLK